jgi:hypothetical protein
MVCQIVYQRPVGFSGDPPQVLFARSRVMCQDTHREESSNAIYGEETMSPEESHSVT